MNILTRKKKSFKKIYPFVDREPDLSWLTVGGIPVHREGIEPKRYLRLSTNAVYNFSEKFELFLGQFGDERVTIKTSLDELQESLCGFEDDSYREKWKKVFNSSYVPLLKKPLNPIWNKYYAGLFETKHSTFLIFPFNLLAFSIENEISTNIKWPEIMASMGINGTHKDKEMPIFAVIEFTPARLERSSLLSHTVYSAKIASDFSLSDTHFSISFNLNNWLRFRLDEFDEYEIFKPDSKIDFNNFKGQKIDALKIEEIDFGFAQVLNEKNKCLLLDKNNNSLLSGNSKKKLLYTSPQKIKNKIFLLCCFFDTTRSQDCWNIYSYNEQKWLFSYCYSGNPVWSDIGIDYRYNNRIYVNSDSRGCITIEDSDFWIHPLKTEEFETRLFIKSALEALPDLTNLKELAWLLESFLPTHFDYHGFFPKNSWLIEKDENKIEERIRQSLNFKTVPKSFLSLIIDRIYWEAEEYSEMENEIDINRANDELRTQFNDEMNEMDSDWPYD
jgi:hypothetical protein